MRTLTTAQALLADIHRENGDLEKAEHFAELAAASTQASGDMWAVPQRLKTLAELHVSRENMRWRIVYTTGPARLSTP